MSKQVSHGSSEWFWNTTPRSGPGPGDLAAGAEQHAGGRLEQPRDEVEQRRLAAARVADQRDELALARPTRSMSRSATNGPRFVSNVMPTLLDADELGRRRAVRRAVAASRCMASVMAVPTRS